MKKIIIVACFLVAVFLQEGLAWGQNGHRVVGLVAQDYLKPKVKKKVLALLQGNSLAEVSVWMDDIKSDRQYDHTHDWHWVTIPEGKDYEQSPKNPKGDLVMKLEELIAALERGGLSEQQEQEYLKFLVHLMGDLHQPLHVGQKDDRGGNQVKVEWFGKNSNLHRVWDSDMIESKDLSFTEMYRFLDKPNKATIKALQAGDVRAWAQDSQSLLPQVYEMPESKKLGYQYLYQHWNTVEQQLLKAGIRLAAVLNEIYG